MAAPAAPQPGGAGDVVVGIAPATAEGLDDRARYDYADTEPGQVIEDHIAVSNRGSQAVDMVVYAQDALNTSDGGYDLQTPETPPVDVGSWVSLAQSQLRVEPDQQVIIPFTLTVPGNAEPGDHSGGIVAVVSGGASDGSGSQVLVNRRVGVRIYLSVNGQATPSIATRITSVDYTAPGGVSANGTSTVTYEMQNTGNLRVEASESVTVDGLTAPRREAKPTQQAVLLLPGNTVTRTVEVSGVWPAGRLGAEVAVDWTATDNGRPESGRLSDSRGFWALGVQTLVVAVVVLLLLLRLAFDIRGLRRRRARRGAAQMAVKVSDPV